MQIERIELPLIRTLAIHLRVLGCLGLRVELRFQGWRSQGSGVSIVVHSLVCHPTHAFLSLFGP